MDHVAIMKKSWGMLPKILSGEKKIESRWSVNKSAPWGLVKRGDVVYFKNSGEPVKVRSKVLKVLSYEGLTPQKVRKILKKFGHVDGIQPGGLNRFYRLFKGKKYCLIIFLKNPQKIAPFEVSKKGFGAMAAWISVRRISSVKILFP